MRIFLFLSLLISFAFAAPSYNELLKKIKVGDFAGAHSGLETFVKGRWKAGEQEKAVVLYIESCIRLGKLDEARTYADQFLYFFPKSQYRARVETAAAVVSILEKDSYSGAETLRRVLTYTKNPVAAARTCDLLSKIFSADLLSIDELNNMLEKGIADKQVRGLAQLSLGQKMQKENRYKGAVYWYDKAKNSDSTLAEKVNALKSSLEGKGAGNPVILVLAPLSGAHSYLGNYMVQGVMLYADNLPSKVRIQILDERAEPTTALKKIKQAIAQDSVVAVIGPLLSPSAAIVAAWMSEKAPQIPLITPTATEDGIAEMGKNIFQLNVSSAKLASSIAEYAMNCLHVNEFAIMSPNNEYGSLMASEFQRAVERKGRVVFAIQNYTEGTPDYRSEFKLLRIRKLMFDARRTDVNKGNKVPGNYKVNESTLIFPAIFIPSSTPKDAGLMASHAIFSKIKTNHLLGSSSWYGREFLLNAKEQAEGSAFSIAFLSNGESEKKFFESYKNKWQKEPDENKVAGLSYDAIRIIGSALNTGAEFLLAEILRKKEYDGVYGKISFTEGGANENVEIIMVEQGKFAEKANCQSTDSHD